MREADLPLYGAVLVRWHVECCVHSQKKKDMKQVSGPQRAHKAPKMFKVLEHCSNKERLRVWGLPNWRGKKSQGELFSTYNSLMGGNEDQEVKLFSVVPTDRKRGNGYKLKHIKFYLMTRKLFFLLWSWSKLERIQMCPSNSSIYKIQVTLRITGG